MKCRDFSGPDSHAARFPRQGIPTQDIGWLAQQLTSPFSSLTDKARSIFTWLHHNIAYDAAGFFSGNIMPSTPGGTIASGLAVCEGYAGLFTALATTAGLESFVVGGHGMGYGMNRLEPGQPVPSFNSNHAWNVVRIDDGEWKLLDPCWGAGHLEDDQQYHKKFDPVHFTMSNNEFGWKHFPTDQSHFFRTDGRMLSWEEYNRGPDGPGEKLTVYTGCQEEHGLSEDKFVPKKKHIQVRGQPGSKRVQFQMEKVCEHWDNERMGKGKPYVYVLSVGGKDGRKRDNIPFQTHGGFWYVDVPAVELGCAGQTVQVYAVTSVGGQDGRGMTVKEYQAAVGRKGMGFGGVAAWQLI